MSDGTQLNGSGWQAFFDVDAATYDAQEYARPWKEEAEFYLDVLDLAPGSSILDLGCGTGRHAVPIAQRGYRVVGVDLSAGMLARARAKAGAAGAQVLWVQANLARFATSVQFDGAICMLEAAFGFMGVDEDPDEHDLAVLRNVRAALRPGARFLLGASNAYKTIRDYSQDDVRTGRFDPITMIQEHYLTWASPDGVEHRVKVRHRPYVPPEVAALLRRAGFHVEHVWGGTHGRGEIVLDDYLVTVVAKNPD